MNFYLILPEYDCYRKYQWYFKRVFDCFKNTQKIFFCSKVPKTYAEVLPSVEFLPLSDIQKLYIEGDVVFDFLGCQELKVSRYYNLDLTGLDCCLYSCLYLKNYSGNHYSNVDFPVELLSENWFDILFKPDLDLPKDGYGREAAVLDLNLSSESRARMSNRVDDVSAACFFSGLEALLLGKKVNFPEVFSPSAEINKQHYLTSVLIPSTVLTEQAVFDAFISSLDDSPLIDDSLLRLHHQILRSTKNQKSKKVQQKIRKLKRDPVLFFSDAIKKLIR